MWLSLDKGLKVRNGFAKVPQWKKAVMNVINTGLLYL